MFHESRADLGVRRCLHLNLRWFPRLFDKWGPMCFFFFFLFLKPLNTNTDNKRCLPIWCFSLIMWPFSLFCSVYLPCGMQDVKGWPTRSPMCLSRKATARRIRERERGDRLSHPDAANLLPASHVNRYAIVWSTACLAWTEPQPRR